MILAYGLEKELDDKGQRLAVLLYVDLVRQFYCMLILYCSVTLNMPINIYLFNASSTFCFGCSVCQKAQEKMCQAVMQLHYDIPPYKAPWMISLILQIYCIVSCIEMLYGLIVRFMYFHFLQITEKKPKFLILPLLQFCSGCSGFQIENTQKNIVIMSCNYTIKYHYTKHHTTLPYKSTIQSNCQVVGKRKNWMISVKGLQFIVW